MELISGRNNEKIKMLSKLLSSSSFRREKGLFVVEGVRLSCDAFVSGIKINEIFFTKKAMEKYHEELAFSESSGAKIFEITEEIADKISDTVNSQGVFCLCEMLDKNKNAVKIKNSGYYLALENIQSPQNLGAILRTAEALAVDAVIVSGGCDLYNPKVQRAAMGASFRVNLIETDDFLSLLNEARAFGINSYACVPDRKALSITAADFSHGAICFIGNEGAGLSEELIAMCGERITIPMRGNAESLNAAGAAAIVMWEMLKQ